MGNGFLNRRSQVRILPGVIDWPIETPQRILPFPAINAVVDGRPHNSGESSYAKCADSGQLDAADPTHSITVADSSSRNRRTGDRKSTRLNSSHTVISYAVFCLKKKKYLHREIESAREHI